MTAVAPERRGHNYRRRYHADDEGGVNPLMLFADWRRGAPGFARPGPPPRHRRVRFTCAACRAQVSPAASRCSCGEPFWLS